MTTEPGAPTGSPSSPPPPPLPPSSPWKHKRLVRLPHEGPIAGVCAGVADYFEVDPTLVRIGAVVLTIMGPGIPAYLLAWLFVPAAGHRAIAQGAAPRGSRWDRSAQVVGLVLIICALSVLWGDWWSPAPRWFVPIGLVALGIWLLIRKDRDDDPTLPGPAGDPSPWRAPAATDTPTATEASDVTDTDTLTDDAESPIPDETAIRAPWESGDGGPPDEPPTLVHDPFGPPPPPAHRRRRRLLTPMVFGALLVWGGIAWLSGVNLDDGLAIGLCIIGVGFVVGAFIGGSWGLVFPAVVVGGALLVVSVVDIPLDGGIGDRTWTEIDVDSQREVFERGIGKGTVDLSRLEIEDGETVEIDATVGIGELTVYVPDDVNLEIRTDVGAGESDVLGLSDDGWDIESNRSFDGDSDQGTLRLDLHVGLGHLEVQERFEDSRVRVPR